VEAATLQAKLLRRTAKRFRAALKKGNCRLAFQEAMVASSDASAASQILWKDYGERMKRLSRGRSNGKGSAFLLPGSAKTVFSIQDKFMRKCLLPK
jgi:hypothetical protein